MSDDKKENIMYMNGKKYILIEVVDEFIYPKEDKEKTLLEKFKDWKKDYIGFDYEDEQACLAAVNENGYAIKYLDNPSEEVLKLAHEKDLF